MWNGHVEPLDESCESFKAESRDIHILARHHGWETIFMKASTGLSFAQWLLKRVWLIWFLPCSASCCIFFCQNNVPYIIIGSMSTSQQKLKLFDDINARPKLKPSNKIYELIQKRNWKSASRRCQTRPQGAHWRARSTANAKINDSHQKEMY